jgi:hypothetical protein
MTQDYANHRHRPALSIAVYAMAFAAAICLVLGLFGWNTEGRAMGCLIAAVFGLAAISRRYTTRLQDRVIKMEMRYRTDRLLSAEQRETLWKLSRPQIVALRFASDAELPALIERAAKEHLSGDAIKRAIKTWVPDLDRT